MEIKNKDIVLKNDNGEYQKISFKAGTQLAHIWYDDMNDEIIIDGALRVGDIDSDAVNVTLSHNQLSDMNISPYIHLTQDEYDRVMSTIDGSLITNLHWHETVNGHKITINNGQLPSSNNAFDVHIIIE